MNANATDWFLSHFTTRIFDRVEYQRAKVNFRHWQLQSKVGKVDNFSRRWVDLYSDKRTMHKQSKIVSIPTNFFSISRCSDIQQLERDRSWRRV